MRRFDVVSTISHRMHQRLLDKGVAPAKATVAPNWVDIEAISPSAFAALAPVWGEAPVVNHFRALLDIAPQTVVALYSGNMGAKQGLELLAQAAALLAEAAPRFTHAPKIQFVFCGNGAGREQLVAQCAGLANVHFLDLQPMHLLSELLGTATLPPELGSAPVSALPEPCGVVVPPEQPLLFSEALLQLAQDPDTRYQMGESARHYAETHLHVDAVLGRFVTRLEQELLLK